MVRFGEAGQGGQGAVRQGSARQGMAVTFRFGAARFGRAVMVGLDGYGKAVRG
jgi:hypothetical protein